MRRSTGTALLRAMRPPHWLKNGFVLAPLIFSRAFHDTGAVAATAWVVLVFCLLASACYLWNDYRDAARDREHAGKRKRPMASGGLGPGTALSSAAGLAAVAALLLLKAPEAAPYAALYAAINIGYSAGLKHVPWLDLLLLTSGYLLRVFAGAAAIHVAPSAWMLSATFALALFLAALKRYAELSLYGTRARAVLAKYRPESLRIAAYAAGAWALVCYVTFSAWVRPALLFTAPLAAAGVLRYGWLVIHRRGSDSPFELIGRDAWLVFLSAAWLFGTMLALW